MAPSAEEKRLWLGLYLIPGLGNRLIRRLVAQFGSAAAVFQASASDLKAVEGLRKPVAEAIRTQRFSVHPETELERAAQCGARIVIPGDAEYPEPLGAIHSPPMLLYVRGIPLPGSKTCLAMVGSRHPTDYGRRTARRIAIELAERGVVVASGLAQGIDTAAHEGAMQGLGHTIAVLGTGVDRVYPVENRKLAKEIAERGTLISEFPMGTPPDGRNFPIRNRIINGLSRGVLVVEATRKSGSLITASMALDEGRDVFAVPGSIESFKSKGTHWLIKQGAKLVETADDVLEEFGCIPRSAGDPPRQTRASAAKATESLTERERMIFDLIDAYPVHIDHIVRTTGLDAGTVSGTLIRLELLGVIRQLPGNQFIR